MEQTTENIWRDFSTPLRRFIARRVSDAHSADDILQQVFVKIHERIGTLRTEAKLESWLYQITRNAIIDYYRSRRASEPLPDTLPAAENEQANEAAEKLRPCVAVMIDKLDGKYRDALRLTEYDGLTQRELATRMGISLTGAKSRVQRGRAKLKEMLLKCCHFEFDRYGNILDYKRKCACDGCSNKR